MQEKFYHQKKDPDDLKRHKPSFEKRKAVFKVLDLKEQMNAVIDAIISLDDSVKRIDV